jgi:hypothetical protein
MQRHTLKSPNSSSGHTAVPLELRTQVKSIQSQSHIATDGRSVSQ